MRPRSINWLAVFAAALALAAVASNYDLAFTLPWLVGFVVGVVAALAWLHNKSLGTWLAGAAAVLAVVRLFAWREATAIPVLASSSGACLGLMLALGAAVAWRRIKRWRSSSVL